MDIIFFPCTIPKINFLVTEFKDKIISFYPPLKFSLSFLAFVIVFWMRYVLSLCRNDHALFLFFISTTLRGHNNNNKNPTSLSR